MGGAMENWGLVTFRESAVLFDPSTGSVADKKLVTMIVNHELAHQVRAMFSPHQDTCASRCVDATLNIFVHGSILNLVCCYNQLQKILRHFEQKCISRFHWMAKKKFSVKKPIATPPPLLQFNVLYKILFRLQHCEGKGGVAAWWTVFLLLVIFHHYFCKCNLS